jgi:succinyl-CoA synthetase beta subunit
MLSNEITQILDRSQTAGWVLEPDAKDLLSLAGIKVPRFTWARTPAEALHAAAAIGYPVVAKVVSPEILHKSDVGGVAVGIKDDTQMADTYNRFSAFKGFAGAIIEQTVHGIELIVGGKIDYQFGAVVLLGIGGTGVEVYQDTTLRMAPVTENDVRSMVDSLQGGKLLSGYRGAAPVSLEKLSQLVKTFSELLIELEGRIESVDLNPVMCAAEACVVADARIVLKSGKTA